MFQDALALHRQGKLNEAASGYESVLALDPRHLDALLHLGVLRLGQGLPGEAETLMRRAATLAPEISETHANLAAALQALGRYEEAVGAYRRALKLRPEIADAQFGLAACLQALGQNDEAIAAYQSLLATQPGHPEANFGLASLLAKLDRSPEAILRYRAALAADPDFAEASYNLGVLLTASGMSEEAITCFRDALDVDTEYVEARLALATALSRLNRDDEAIAAFEASLSLQPENPGAHAGLGVLLDRKRRYAEAIDHYRAGLAQDPQHIGATEGMAAALKNAGRHDEALATARRALALRPDSPSALALVGSILAELGSMEEALALFRRAVSLAPEQLPLSYHLVQLTKVRPDDPAIRAFEKALARIEALSIEQQCLLHFGLAKAYSDIGEPDKGFDHALQGNAIKRAQVQYDEMTALVGVDQLSRVFTAELLSARKNLGDPSDVPVFIVGMPRSGTTLVEQTLASHAAVFGAGERSELSKVISRVNAGSVGGAPVERALWTMHGDQIFQMGADYVTALRALAPDFARITDKMPINFVHVGWIHLILPNARIIHIRRDPVDTCLSCFSLLFAGDQPFAYDLAELGRFYRAYRRLMAHWRTVLPPGVLLEVQYEDLVQDFEAQARRLVAHCSLAWDPACLDFHKTSRPVHTASLTQVRRPIYKSSVGRWRPAPALLKPLLDALAE